MRIAICDDVTADRQAIAVALDEYLKMRGLSAAVEEFACPAALLTAVRAAPFDLYLLDVLLDDALTGIDLVRQLQSDGNTVPVVFFSTSREYAVDAFAVEAISYLQKPWNKASFTRTLDRATEAFRKRMRSTLAFRTGSGIVRFAATEIESVETARTVNYLTIYRANGQAITIRGSIRSFAAQYHDPVRLVSAGRSILLNPTQIASLEKSCVRFFSGRSLSVSPRVYAALANEILSLSVP